MNHFIKNGLYVLKEPAPKKAVAATNGNVAKKSKDDSSSEDESSDEVNFLLLCNLVFSSLELS